MSDIEEVPCGSVLVPVLMRPREVAAKLKVSLQRLAGWRRRGVGPKWIQFSQGTVRYRKFDVEIWLWRDETESEVPDSWASLVPRPAVVTRGCTIEQRTVHRPGRGGLFWCGQGTKYGYETLPPDSREWLKPYLLKLCRRCCGAEAAEEFLRTRPTKRLAPEARR
jgi:hypothetical protein